MVVERRAAVQAGKQMVRATRHFTKQPPGRPPAGRGGVAVTRGYVQTTLRLDPETKELLDALTRLLGRSQRQVMDDALVLYAKRLRLSDQELLHGLLHRKG